jgi:hypothetical protein
MEASFPDPVAAQETASGSILGFSGDPQVFAARWAGDGLRASGNETIAVSPTQQPQRRRPMRWREAYARFGLPERENDADRTHRNQFSFFPAWR